MRVFLDQIDNIKPIKKTSRLTIYSHFYTVLARIGCEYAISILKKNKDDELFRNIHSCIITKNISVKKLFTEEFTKDDEMQELCLKLAFHEGDDSFQEVLKKVEWEATDECNRYYFGGSELFSSPKLLLDLKEKDGKYYALERKICETSDEFVVINGTEDLAELGYSISSRLEDLFNFNIDSINLSEHRHSEFAQITDEQFFNNTTKLKEADDEQKGAIRAGIDKNLLIIAGAGSGKTRSLVGRLTYLHTVKGIPLNRIMLLTFTRAATQEMGAAAYQQIKEVYSVYEKASNNPIIQARTIESFFKFLIDKYYFDVGLKTKPEFFLEERNAEKYRLLSEVIRENKLSSVFKEYLNDKRDYKTKSFTLKDLYFQLENVANGKVVNISGIENLLELYIQKQISTNKIVGFVYISCILDKALEDTNCALYQRLDDLYDCILIDEFQDVNKLQNDVLSHFYKSRIHFTFVGDDDQTIYTWRGADNSIIKNMAQDKNYNIIYLTTNYRNNPYIVKAGNDILATIENRAKVGREIKPAKQTGCKIRVATYDEKYENLAHEIKKVYETRADGEKICILFREGVKDKIKEFDGKSEKEEGEATKLANLLSYYNIRVNVEEGAGIYYSDGYKVFKALVYILNKVDVRNSCAFLKDLSGTNSSKTNIRRLVWGKISSDKFSHTPNTFNIEVLEKLSNAINSQSSFAMSFYDLICNYNREYSLTVEKLNYADRETKDEVLIQFEDFASKYNWAYPMGKEQLKKVFGVFEEEIIRKTTKKSLNEDNDSASDVITISSIHHAKGLQYDTVFIVGLNDGEYPNTSMINNEYNERINQLQRLKVSQTRLEELRGTIGQDTIDNLITECRSNVWKQENDPQLVADMNDMAEVIDAFTDECLELSAEGIDEFMGAFNDYVAIHVDSRQDLINKKNNEISVIQEKADIKEEEYHEANEGSEEQERLHADWEALLQEVKIKQNSLIAYTKRLDEFIKNIGHLLAFNNVCQEAKGYIADVQKLINETKTIQKLEKERKERVMEEKRLFYVAVSRASEKLYLCVKEHTKESEFIKIINKDNLEPYVMLTKYKEDEIQRLTPFIQELREESEKDTINESKVEKNVEKILNSSDVFKDEIQEYLNKYIAEHPQYQDLPDTARVYFNNIIELVAFSEKLGLSFKEATAHYILKFIHQLLLEKIGNKVKPFKTDTDSASTIIKDIRRISINGCKVAPPGETYLLDLLTKEAKYSGDEFDKCKSLVIQCYIVCSGKYRVPDYIMGTWGIKSFSKDNPEKFLIAALDLTNIRNIMIHDKMELWSTDNLPYAFSCMDTVMLYIGKVVKNAVQYQDDVDLNETVVAQRLRSEIISHKNLITDINKLHSFIKDIFETKIAKVLCIIDEKVLKDIVSGVVNSRRGTDAAYLRNQSHYSNDMCLQVLSIWESIIDTQTKEILKKII